MAKVPPNDFSRLFPVEMSDVDTFAAPEPSIGGIVQLNSGQYLGINYGKVSGTLVIYIPPNEEAAGALKKIHEEIPLLHEYIWWRRDQGLIKPQ